MQIPSSELIINQDGSVYHLGIKPGEISTIIITVGDPDRVPLVSQYFDEIYLKVHKREMVTHTGRLGNQVLTVISTGMGTDNIDIVLNELDAVFNIDFESRIIKKELTKLKIIRLGTSGGIQEDIPLGTILASEFAIGYDGLLGFYQSTPHRFSNIHIPELGGLKGFVVPGSEYLLNTVAKNYMKGVTYTAAGFYAPQGRQLRAVPAQKNLLEQLHNVQLPENRRITNIEMETAGLYGLGHVLGHDMISVSVLLANRINGTFSADPESAVKNMIENCLERISDI